MPLSPLVSPQFLPKSSSAENHCVTWGTWAKKQESPTSRDACFLAFCCFCTNHFVRDRKGTPKNFCDKDFAEFSAELSGAICLKTLVLLGSVLELFRKFFGAVHAILWLWGSLLALDFRPLLIRLVRQQNPGALLGITKETTTPLGSASLQSFKCFFRTSSIRFI